MYTCISLFQNVDPCSVDTLSLSLFCCWCLLWFSQSDLSAFIMTSQLWVPWKPVSGKWEQCVYWSPWNMIQHRQKVQRYSSGTFRGHFCGSDGSRSWCEMTGLSQRWLLDALFFFSNFCIAFFHFAALWPSPLFLPPQAFGQAYTNQRKVAEDGETNEETLLQESASKEAYYVDRLSELQMEVALSHSVASNAKAENERLNALVQELREVSLSTHTEDVFCKFEKENTGNQALYDTVYVINKKEFQFLDIF